MLDASQGPALMSLRSAIDRQRPTVRESFEKRRGPLVFSGERGLSSPKVACRGCSVSRVDSGPPFRVAPRGFEPRLPDPERCRPQRLSQPPGSGYDHGTLAVSHRVRRGDRSAGLQGDHERDLPAAAELHGCEWRHRPQLAVASGRAEQPPVGATTATESSATVSFASITAGFAFTCALTPGGAAYCWGINASDQLGEGTTKDRSTPVAVLGPSGSTGPLSLGLGRTLRPAVTGTYWNTTQML